MCKDYKKFSLLKHSHTHCLYDHIFFQIVITVRENIRTNGEDYLNEYMNHINNGPCQVLKKDPTTKIKAKTLKQLKGLNDNECNECNECNFIII